MLKIVEQSAQILSLSRQRVPALELVERAGRTCYQSEGKIGCVPGKDEGIECHRDVQGPCGGCALHSSNKFAKMLIKRGHTAMLEFGDIYLHAKLPIKEVQRFFTGEPIWLNQFVRYYGIDDGCIIVGNLRSMIEFAHSGPTKPFRDLITVGVAQACPGVVFALPDVAEYQELLCICSPVSCEEAIDMGMPIEEATMTVLAVTNRGVSHEIVRHRLCSFAQESTRYVNYGGKPIEFIRPVWIDEDAFEQCGREFAAHMQEDVDYGGHTALKRFVNSCVDAEVAYNELLGLGWRPEQAREVLPNSLKTAIVIKATYSQWTHMFKLRSVGTTGRPHPQMQALADIILRKAADNDVYWEGLARARQENPNT